MATQAVAQYVPGPFHADDAAVWADVDEDTDLMPVLCRSGPLFTLDMRTGRAFDVNEEVCYFIGPENGTHVKIGKSIDVKKRLRALQMSSPVRLKIHAMVKGGGAQEVAYHLKFRASRAWGEWFYRSNDIEREIERLQRPVGRAELRQMDAVEYVIEADGSVARAKTGEV